MNTKRILCALKEPKKFLTFFIFKTARIYPDEIYQIMLFPLSTGYKLKHKIPQTYNEKL